MALNLLVNLPTGVSATYHRVESFRWDRAGREVSVSISLFLNKETADAGGAPIAPVFAKLRIKAAEFQRLLSSGAMDGNIVALFYTAMKQASEAAAELKQLQALENPTQVQLNRAIALQERLAFAHVICDAGKDAYANATDI